MKVVLKSVPPLANFDGIHGTLGSHEPKVLFDDQGLRFWTATARDLCHMEVRRTETSSSTCRGLARVITVRPPGAGDLAPATQRRELNDVGCLKFKRIIQGKINFTHNGYHWDTKKIVWVVHHLMPRSPGSNVVGDILYGISSTFCGFVYYILQSGNFAVFLFLFYFSSSSDVLWIDSYFIFISYFVQANLTCLE